MLMTNSSSSLPSHAPVCLPSLSCENNNRASRPSVRNPDASQTLSRRSASLSPQLERSESRTIYMDSADNTAPCYNDCWI
jgi:hypothetical protein